MNKTRRKELMNVIDALQIIADKDDLYDVINDLENIRDEEEDYYDNIPENLQSSRRASDSEDAIEALNDALDLMDEAYESDDQNKMNDLIKLAIGKINSAIF